MLIHGKPINAEEIERYISREFTSTQFASLCNAVAWTSANRICTSLPSFTERTNAKDGGIDAEWYNEFPDDGDYSSPLIGPGWNVFQYKKRDAISQDRKKALSNLEQGITGAIKDLFERTKKRVGRYVLFTNLDLTHFTEAKNATAPEKASLKKAILKDYDQPKNVHVEIVAAAELATLLNDSPPS